MSKIHKPGQQLPEVDITNSSYGSQETDNLLDSSHTTSTVEVGLLPRLIPLAVGCICMIGAGSNFAFAAYTNAVKKHFGYTQSQVELISSMGNFGISIGLPAGVMCERFGARWTSLAALIISTGSMMLLWSTTFTEEFYSRHALLQSLYFFFAGFGAIFFYMASMITSMNNFQPRHRGKVVGTLEACFSGGPALFSLIYGSCFVKGHVNDEENQDLRGFYFLNSIVFAAVGLLGILLLKTYPIVKEENPTTTQDQELEQTHKQKVIDVTGCALIRRSDFHFMLWPFMFCSGLHLMFQNNLAVYLKSFNIEQYTTLFTTLSPIASILSKICVGLVSDAVVHKIPRPAVLLFFYVLQTLVFSLCIFFANNFILLMITLLVVGFSNGSLWCLSSTIISELYGLKYFGRNWGTTLIGNAIGGFCCQQIFGALYDYSIGLDGVKDCYGIKCFKLSFIVAAIMSLSSCLLSYGLLQSVMEDRKRTKSHHSINTN